MLDRKNLNVTVVEEKLIPDATAKLLECYKFDYAVFKFNKSWAFGNDIINRLALEPSFEAIVDAGEWFSFRYYY